MRRESHRRGQPRQNLESRHSRLLSVRAKLPPYLNASFETGKMKGGAKPAFAPKGNVLELVALRFGTSTIPILKHKAFSFLSHYYRRLVNEVQLWCVGIARDRDSVPPASVPLRPNPLTSSFSHSDRICVHNSLAFRLVTFPYFVALGFQRLTHWAAGRGEKSGACRLRILFRLAALAAIAALATLASA